MPPPEPALDVEPEEACVAVASLVPASFDLGASLSDQGHGGMIDGFGGLRVKV